MGSNHTMASAKPLTMLVARSRPTARLTSSSSIRTIAAPATSPLAAFSTTTFRTYATPSGPPPAGFRLPKPERWDQSKESTLDKAGKYFLLTEMARGMYVVLEQYFRPPYTIFYPFEKGPISPRSEANTLYEDTHPAKNVALHASYAKLSAPPKQLPSKLRSVRTEVVERHAMIST